MLRDWEGMVSICILWLILLRGVIWFMLPRINMFEDIILLLFSIALEYKSWPIMFLPSIMFDEMSCPRMLEVIPMMFTSMLGFIMSFNISRSNMLDVLSRPIRLVYMSRPIMLVDLSVSRPIMLEDIA